MSISNNPIWKVHQKFMTQALELAKKASKMGEIPVGALIVRDNKIIGKGYNQVENLKNATAHAEMIAISEACNFLGNKYLKNASLYVTLEPCPMCAGAIIWSKIDRVVFGASDTKLGAGGSLFNILQNQNLNHQPEIIQGILEHESEHLLKSFFNFRRK